MFENVLELKKDAKPECHAGYIKNNYLNTVQWNCRISKINLTSHERKGAKPTLESNLTTFFPTIIAQKDEVILNVLRNNST